VAIAERLADRYRDHPDLIVAVTHRDIDLGAPGDAAGPGESLIARGRQN